MLRQGGLAQPLDQSLFQFFGMNVAETGVIKIHMALWGDQKRRGHGHQIEGALGGARVFAEQGVVQSQRFNGCTPLRSTLIASTSKLCGPKRACRRWRNC